MPRTIEEIVAATLACVDAGATIVHNHNDEPNFGESSVHSAEPYEAAWSQIWNARPGLLIHPTTSGERSCTITDRFSHIVELHERDSLTMTTVDAGCLSLAIGGHEGPLPLPVFGNSAADVDQLFGWCRDVDLPLHVSIFEPGFLRLTLAHRKAGRLPMQTKVQLHFGGEAALFGLPPTQASLNTDVEMLSDTRRTGTAKERGACGTGGRPRRTAWSPTGRFGRRDGDPVGLALNPLRKAIFRAS